MRLPILLPAAALLTAGLTVSLGLADPGDGENKAADDLLCERLVEFRDGSILRLELPKEYLFSFREPNLAEETEGITFELERPRRIRFSRLPALKQLKRIQEAIKQLESESFVKREEGLLHLLKNGNGFRPLLEDLQGKIKQPESRWRITDALRRLPKRPGIYEHAYDEIDLEGEVSKGDIAEWKIESDYRGAKVRLAREFVRAIRPAPDGGVGDSPVIATAERIPKDLDILFPKECIRIDFETDSHGQPLRESQDVSRRFIFDGAIFETSIPDAIFSVSDFGVDGRSGGLSAATHKPPFEGVITVTFCVPGNEHEPGGVTHVGLSAGIVQEGGTTLTALDANGHRIHSVTTVVGARQFLGIRSDVPIHQIKIIPNVDIDPDVAIDDLVFDIPQPIEAGGSPDHFRLEFRSGERLVCGDFEFENDKVKTVPAGGYAESISFPQADLIQVRTPTKFHDENPAEEEPMRFWLLLEDGSTLLARQNVDHNPTTLIEGLDPMRLPLVALWSETNDLVPLPPETEIEKGQVAVIATTSVSIFTEPNLSRDQFTAAEGNATVEYSFNRLPTVWMKLPDPEARKRARGFIRLNTGERIVIGEGSLFQFGSYDSKAVTLKYSGKEFRLPIERITSIRLPNQKR